MRLLLVVVLAVGVFVAMEMGRADPRLCMDNREEGCMPIIIFEAGAGLLAS